MPETVSGDMVEPHFHHQFRTQWLPLAAALRAPAARTTRRVAGEARRLAQRLQTLGQRSTFTIGDRRCEADVVELAVLVIETEQQRPDLGPIGKIAEATDDAVGSAHSLHLHHGSFAGR